jgi:hypothetical protein
MPDEPTLGEVDRRLEAVHQDLKDDLRDLARRLDKKVDTEVFKLEQAAQDRAVQLLAERLTAIETAREREAEHAREERLRVAAQRTADRRLVLTAFITPILLVLLQAWLATKGAGGS